MSTHLEAQSHAAAFCIQHRWKTGEFLPQTTSNLSKKYKCHLITTHDIWGEERPTYIREKCPTAEPASLACSTGPVMTDGNIPFLGFHQRHPVVGNRREPEAPRSLCDHLLAEDGAASRDQSSGTIPRSASHGASARAWPTCRNPMFRKPFSCLYKQFDHNSPIPGSEASFKCWSVEAHN